MHATRGKGSTWFETKGAGYDLMMIMKKPQLANDHPSGKTMPSGFSWDRTQSFLQDRTSQQFRVANALPMDQLLLARTRTICERYKIHFAHLSTIQRKFVTHYRCDQCGLLPLYYLDLSHIKRVRCRKCGQLIGFKRKGKYGKLRKEIAFELTKEIQGGIVHAE